MTEKKRSHRAHRQNTTETTQELDQIPADIPPENLESLKALIDSFNTSTARLREAYSALQDKVENLNLQLEESNRNLSESLAEQERLSNYLTNILESFSSGVLVIDTKGVITLFNRGAEIITGVKVKSALNRPYHEIMGTDVPEELTPLRALSSGEGLAQFEKNIIAKNKKLVPVGCSISPLVNSSGEVIGAVEIFMDMTRIKALEDELARQEKLAALGQMAATMAHKIRNPLGGIAGFAGLLDLEMKDSDNGRRLVAKITEGVDKMDRIVTSMLSYTSQLRLKPHMVDLAELAGDCISEVQMDGTAFECSLSCPDGQVMVEVDPNEFKKAVLFIVRNALEAMENEGVVEILVLSVYSQHEPSHPVAARLLETIKGSSRFRQSGMPGGMLLVTDSGKGISPRTKEQLFVPFYTTKENGIGLGLASAQKIIEGHHGEIWIESEENTGTSVGIVVPRNCSVLL